MPGGTKSWGSHQGASSAASMYFITTAVALGRSLSTTVVVVGNQGTTASRNIFSDNASYGEIRICQVGCSKIWALRFP